MRRLVLMVVLLLGARGAVADPPPFVVIVNAQNPTTAVDRKFVADAFLKKIARWDQRDVIRPVDQPQDSAVRRHFTELFLKRSVPAVRRYWQQLIFSGRDVPPPELDDDAAVVSYVMKYRGAIGYVSPGADVQGVKVISVK